MQPNAKEVKDLIECPKCNGEGFLIVEDIEIQAIKECEICKGEGYIADSSNR